MNTQQKNTFKPSCKGFVLVLSFLYMIHRLSANADRSSKSPLFPPNHPNITFLTDSNFQEIVNNSKVPWIIDFYHPFCPHCKKYVPEFTRIAAYYKELGNPINIGGISCMDNVKCRLLEIDSYPTIYAFGFDSEHPGEPNKFLEGTHTLDEVKTFVAELNNLYATMKQKKPEVTQATNEPTATIWEETTLPSNHSTRLKDAASAFIFGIKEATIMKGSYLEDYELDALKEYILIVSQSFPGSMNRKVIDQLYQKLKPIGLLQIDQWKKMVTEWQFNSTQQLQLKDWNKLQHADPWQNITNLFEQDGMSYTACGSYTCGQWTLFHILTINPINQSKSDDLLISTLASFRRFVKYFFGCVQCRQEFLKKNDLKMLMVMSSSQDKYMFLKLWSWRMHNSVNKRVGHLLWPSREVCSACYDKNNKYIDSEVIEYLTRYYGYNEISEAPTKNRYGLYSYQMPSKISELSTLPSTQVTRIQDASSAFIYGLNHLNFTSDGYLEDDDLDALKKWVHIVSKSFPGSINRVILKELYKDIEKIPFLHEKAWENILKTWQKSAIEHINNQNWNQLKDASPWQQVQDLFQGNGSEYKACHGYLCGQWNLFHLMTMNPYTSKQINSGINEKDYNFYFQLLIGFQRFMKYLFVYKEYKDFFIEKNDITMLKRLNNYTDRAYFMGVWGWRMHNSHNKRSGRPMWPKPEICPSCRNEEGEWEFKEVESWYNQWYGFDEDERFKHPLEQSNFRPILSTSDLKSEINQPNPNAILKWYIVPLFAVILFFLYLRPGVRYKPVLHAK